MAIDVEPNMGLHRWNVGIDIYDYTLDLLADKNRIGAHTHGGAPSDGLAVKGIAAGLLTNRPAQSAAGHIYFATDANGGLGALQIDDGGAWKQVPLSTGNGLIISSGGIIVTGQSTITGSLAGATALVVKGVDALAASNALVVQNGIATNLFNVRDDGQVFIGVGPLNMPAQSGGVAKSITWGDNGGGTTSILGNTVGGSPSGGVLRFDIANGTPSLGTTALLLTGGGSVVAGSQVALANGATDGFLYIPTGGGAPTGVPTAYPGETPTRFNSADNKMYAYISGSWKASAAFA